MRLRSERMTVGEAMEWHRFFTFWPRRVSKTEVAFLETIERRYVLVDGLDTYTRLMFGRGYWEYRAVATSKDTP